MALEWIKIHDINDSIARFTYVETHMHLRLVYKGGNSYTWEKIPKTLFEQLKNSENKGEFIDENLHGNYEYYLED